MALTQRLLLTFSTFQLAAIFVLAALLLAIGGLFAVRRVVSHERLKSHNDIAGAIFGTLGMAYTVLLAFVVVVAWQGFDAANMNVEREANFLADLGRNAEGLAPEFRAEARARINEYARSVVEDEWEALRRGEASRRAQKAVDALGTLYAGYAPKTLTEEIFFRESVGELNGLSELRRMRIFDSRTGIHPVLWFVLVVGGLATVAFTFFFGSSILNAQILMTSLLAMVIALILFTILVFDFPFTGGVSISSDAFQRMLKY